MKVVLLLAVLVLSGCRAQIAPYQHLPGPDNPVELHNSRIDDESGMYDDF